MSDIDLKFISAKGLLDVVLNLDYFHSIETLDGKTPIPWMRVDGKSRLIVVVGDNASGKSFFRRLTSLICKENKIKCMSLSVEGRTGGMYGPAAAMVYGDESWQSTGVLSSQTVTTGVKTCRGRNSKHAIFWDEPDLGLSDAWAAGMGQHIYAFAKKCPAKTVAALVVTHSKALVRELLPASPTYVHLGKAPPEAPRASQSGLSVWSSRAVLRN